MEGDEDTLRGLESVVDAGSRRRSEQYPQSFVEILGQRDHQTGIKKGFRNSAYTIIERNKYIDKAFDYERLGALASDATSVARHFAFLQGQLDQFKVERDISDDVKTDDQDEGQPVDTALMIDCYDKRRVIYSRKKAQGTILEVFGKAR